MCLNGVGGAILLLQNNEWIVSELKEGNYLGLMSWESLFIIQSHKIIIQCRKLSSTGWQYIFGDVFYIGYVALPLVKFSVNTCN